MMKFRIPVRVKWRSSRKGEKSRFEEAGTSLYPELAKQHLSLYSLPLETLRMNFFLGMILIVCRPLQM